MGTGDSPVQRASADFVAEFVRWRTERGLSKKQLAAAMGFDPSYLSHVEAHRHRPTEDFAKRAEAVLQAGGAIWRRYRQYDDVRGTTRVRAVANGVREPTTAEPWLPPGTGLVVERETARLSYVDGRYRCTVRRALYNAGSEPVTRFLIRVSVDRYPNESERSNAHHHIHPLSWDELDLVASSGGERMDWRVKTDRDSVKEAWLLFENQHGRFPLYPGRRATIRYTYHVGADKWGPWFQRTVRLPTRRLRIELDLPMSMRPVVWGVETTFSAESIPLRTPIEQEIEGDRAVFGWSTDNPPLHARYRLEWRFRNVVPAQRSGAHDRIDGDRTGVDRVQTGSGVTPVAVAVSPGDVEERGSPSSRMADAGIVQRGAEVLSIPARWFDLPRETELAESVVVRLTRALEYVDRLHSFGKGVGLAAPQLGISLAAAVVRPAGAREPIVLINPRVLYASGAADEQFEGCLSFFDERGLVTRSLRISVESTSLRGERGRTTYDRSMARLIAHEIDHLNGLLYTDRMSPGASLVPYDEYRNSGKPWSY